MDITKNDLWNALRLIKNGEMTSAEVIEQCLDKARATAYLNAYTFVNKDKALANAQKVDKKIQDNKHTGILAGIPIAVKDNICTKGMPTSCGSNMLKGRIFDIDATSVVKLKEQDAVIFGKTNMDEFAMGNGNDTSAFGKTRNPIDTERVPGGSSGGSAVCVAVGSSMAALGTDTGGSVRQPASYCGVTGMIPTFGRISKYGVFPLAPSLDRVGIITKTVRDNLLVFETLYGQDSHDRSSLVHENLNFDTHCLEMENKKLRIAYMAQSFSPIVDSEVKSNFRSVLDFFTNEGYAVDEIDFKFTPYISAIYSILCCGGAVRSLSSMDGKHYGNLLEHAASIEDQTRASRGEFFGLETKRRLIYGEYVTSKDNFNDYFEKARRIRTLIVQYFKDVFRKYDIVITPTTPCPAHKVNSDMYYEQIEFNDVFLTPANFTGRPAITVPSGKTKSGLPLGVHFMGKTFNENDVYNIAYKLEQSIGKEFITRL